MEIKKMNGSLTDGAARLQDQAMDSLRSGRTATADGLDAIAESLNNGGDNVSDMARATATKVGASATYLRNNSPRDMMGDVESLVKAHPGKALIGAIIVGFMAGRMVRAD